MRSAIDGEIKARALEIVREEWRARPDMASEGDAVAAALEEAEREGAALARAVAKGGKLEALVDAAKDNDQKKKQLRARLARIDASPTASLDARRRLAENCNRSPGSPSSPYRPHSTMMLRARLTSVTRPSPRGPSMMPQLSCG